MTNKHATVGICLTISLLFSSFAIVSLCSADASIPSSFDIAFKGILDNDQSLFLFEFTNGSNAAIKDATINFSMTFRNEDTYGVHISVKGDSFFNDTTVDGNVKDGNLVIDSTQSIFKISPQLLNQNGDFVLSETSDWRLVGKVIAPSAKALTTIPDKLVRATMVESFHVTDTASHLPLILGYDPNIGVLVNAGPALSDILLKKIGVDFILGGTFELVSYSKTLNLELISLSSLNSNSNSNNWYIIILLISLPIIFLIAVILFYSARKTRKLGPKSSGNVHNKLQIGGRQL